MKRNAKLAKLVAPVTSEDIVVMVGVLRAVADERETRGTRMLARWLLSRWKLDAEEPSAPL